MPPTTPAKQNRPFSVSVFIILALTTIALFISPDFHHSRRQPARKNGPVSPRQIFKEILIPLEKTIIDANGRNQLTPTATEYLLNRYAQTENPRYLQPALKNLDASLAQIATAPLTTKAQMLLDFLLAWQFTQNTSYRKTAQALGAELANPALRRGNQLSLTDHALLSRAFLLGNLILDKDDYLEAAAQHLQFLLHEPYSPQQAEELSRCEGLVNAFEYTGNSLYWQDFERRLKLLVSRWPPLSPGLNPEMFAAWARYARLLLRSAGYQLFDGHSEQTRKILLSLRPYSSGRGTAIALYADALRWYVNPPLKAVVVGDKEDPATRALFQTWQRACWTRHSTLLLDPQLDREQLAARAFSHTGQPALYLCTADFCLTPVTDTAQIASALKKIPAL